MQWETVIGLEIHTQLATKSKIFSGSSTAFGAAPNTQAALIDLGMPGVLPVLNEEVVRMAVKFGLAIGADTNFFGNEKLAQLTIPMKSVSEALFLRNKILLNLFATPNVTCEDSYDDQQQEESGSRNSGFVLVAFIEMNRTVKDCCAGRKASFSNVETVELPMVEHVAILACRFDRQIPGCDFAGENAQGLIRRIFALDGTAVEFSTYHTKSQICT